MPVDKDQLKAQLLKQYEAHLDEMFERVDPDAALDLSEIEDAALTVRQQAGADITQELAKQQTQRTQADEACPTCGKVMHYKGMKRKQLSTRSGDIDIERAYYYCEQCKRGVFPPG